MHTTSSMHMLLDCLLWCIVSKVHKHAEEVKKLRDQLQKERTEKKKLEQEYSDDENKLSASNKKLVLEVSKLKVIQYPGLYNLCICVGMIIRHPVSV